MKARNPTAKFIVSVTLLTILLGLCAGCSSGKASIDPPAAIFTQAAETAVALQTIAALTPQPPTVTDFPTLSDDLIDSTVIPVETLMASMTGTVISPAGAQPSATPGPDVPTLTPTLQAPIAPQDTATPLPPQASPTSNANPAACIPTGEPQTGKVLQVLDGDTIKVMIEGKTYTVRYIGVDAPEYIKTKEFYGTEAWQKNNDLVFARDITLFKDAGETDDLGRLLRYVKIGDTFINYELISQGYAKAAPAAPNSACDAVFQAAQDQASAAKLGVWSK